MPAWTRSRNLLQLVRRYGLALVAVGLAALVSVTFSDIFSRIPSALLFAAVMVAARYGGLGPSLLASLLGVLAVDYYFVPPFYALGPIDLGELAILGILGLVAVLISSMTARLHASRQSEHRQRRWFETTLTSVGDAVIATDVGARVTFINPVAEQLTGWPKDEAIGRPLAQVFRIVDERARQPVDSPLTRVLRDGVVVGLANRTVLVARDGTERPIDDSGAPIRDERGGVIGAVLVFRDITERRAAERERDALLAQEHAALARSEADGERVVATLESISDAFFAVDREWRYTYVNGRAAAMLGRSREELLGQVIWEAFPQGAASPIAAEYRRAMDEQTARRLEYHSPTLGVWVEVHVYPAADGLSVYFQDVTARRQSEVELEQSRALLSERERQLRRLAESGIVGVMFWDIAGPILDANDELLRILGYGRDELEAGRLDWRRITPDTYRPIDDEKLRELHERGLHAPYEKEYRRQDGSLAPVLVGSAFFEGSRERGISFVLDLTDRRRLERMQQELIANVSHELRNPLAAIRGFAQLMQRREAYNERAVASILAQTGQLDRLIGDLMDASRLEAGSLELRPERLDLVELTRACVEELQAISERHVIRLDAPDRRIEGLWDRDRLSQVFRNLLGNAVKYSPDGGEIAVTVEDHGDEAEVSIRDGGLGIDADSLPRLFARFVRAGAASGSVHGIGLGLYITKELIEAHGGHIRAESDGPGQGSTFRFTLPRPG